MAYGSSAIDPGTNPITPVAVDAIAGVNYQAIKLIDPAAGSISPIGTAANPLPVTDFPATSGGTAGYHKVAAAGNNAAVVKASSGQVYGVHVYCGAGYPVFIKLYDKATAPSVGVDTPVRTIACQTDVRADDLILRGLPFTNGIGIAIVKGLADGDNTSVLLSDCVVDLDYK